MTGTTSRAAYRPDTDVLDAAWSAAEAAQAAAGVQIRDLDALTDLGAVRRLYERVWRTGATNPPVTADLLRAIAKAGGYVSGAYDGGLVGACFGFFSEPSSNTLHSHIAGVEDRVRGRRVGMALKLHQRAWALARGADTVTWTFDPLIRRNAWFNLAKLAADVTEYLPDFYGPLDDDINRSDATDRVLVTWPLTAPAVVAACEGTPRLVEPCRVPLARAAVALEASAAGGPIVRRAYGPTVLVGLTPDIESLRVQDPTCAAEWRAALREVLGGLLGEGGTVRGFDRDGWYVVDRQEGR